MTILTYFLLLPLVLAGLALSIFLALEIAAAMATHEGDDGESDDASAPPFVVVIPAHNEAAGLGPVLEHLRGSLREADRVLVVADNCDDQTADVARAHHAEVIERTDPSRRGKGYALQYALDHLRQAPPAIVVFTDADCHFAAGALQLIASQAHASSRPAQALYLMKAPDGAGPRLQAAEFAWAFINHARMLGLQRLFDVTRFTGAGFAAPWPTLAGLDLASGEIVEDLALTMTMIRNDSPPRMIARARVYSEFPTDDAALTRQAARWSIGSMRYSAGACLKALAEGIAKLRPAQIGAAIDLMIPPLTVFAAGLSVIVVCAFLAGLASGAWWLFGCAVVAFGVTLAAIIAGWLRYGREALPAESIGGLFALLASKASVFGSQGRRSAQSWTPTRGDSDRDGS